ncbi:conserved hypothetical protein [uncultured Desulfobacterium sp.]|uniref:Uncharacterized protein n=1 Tax=uncultured Desulfobacterium sp. TaxID=201089 RepID=A0A445MXF2_9BACT|nr:conserved hypothetical protein [uncultured Desulfobacterium sp.]
MLKNKSTIIFFVLFIIGISSYMASAVKVQALRDRLDPTQIVSALNVSPEVLKIASGEFASLLADYLLLKASVYLGGRDEMPEANQKTVSTLFSQSANLDPYFFQTCYFVQGYLPWWKGDYVKKGIEILELFNAHRDWDWQPGFFIGFDYFYFLRDNLTASRYLMEIAKRHEAAKSLGLLGARLAQRGGETITSIAFLKTMYERTENEAQKEEIARRIEALNGVLILEKGIEQYVWSFGHPPETLEQLTATGILKTLPKNPTRPNEAYLYKNGKIEF